MSENSVKFITSKFPLCLFHACTSVCLCVGWSRGVEVRGQLAVSFLNSPRRLPGQQALGIHLSVPAKRWDSKPTPTTNLALALGTEFKVCSARHQVSYPRGRQKDDGGGWGQGEKMRSRAVRKEGGRDGRKGKVAREAIQRMCHCQESNCPVLFTITFGSTRKHRK